MALFRVVGRIALEILSRVGSRPATLIGGFMAATAFLSMWVSNSAVALVMPAALAASCALMLPIATPPNAIVYGSGRVSLPQMARAGAWINAVMAVLITLFALLLLPVVFGVSPG